jgi:hypothetical protein
VQRPSKGCLSLLELDLLVASLGSAVEFVSDLILQQFDLNLQILPLLLDFCRGLGCF